METRMRGFLFFFTVGDSTSGSCFAYCHGHPLPMSDETESEQLEGVNMHYTIFILFNFMAVQEVKVET
jgi:hypothetical protein